MKIDGHRKQILLFLSAVLVPAVILVALTLRIVRQERELTEKRVADQRRTVVREVGRDVAARLESLVRQESAVLAAEPREFGRRGYVSPEFVLIARVDDTWVVLPWESASGTAESNSFGDASEFGRALRQAEDAEFSQKDHALAAARYRRAAAVAGSPARSGYARLQLARALSRMGHERESLSEYENLLALGPDVVDEYGVPLSMYAAEQLVKAGSKHGQAVERIGRQLQSSIWVSPAGLYLMKGTIEQIIAAAPAASGAAIRGGAQDHLRTILAHIKTMEQALSLKEDFPRLGLGSPPGPNVQRDDARWVVYGRQPWLVGLSAPISGRASLLVAIDLRTFSSAFLSKAGGQIGLPDGATLVMGLPAGAASLSPDVPGLSIVFGAGADDALSRQWSLQRLYYFVALVIVLAVTLFGAYLLWRDVRREVLMAETRSQFVSSVSHELKTPLTAIRMFAETLRLGRPRDPAMQMEYLDTIVSESERLTRLLNNVLDFSTIERGKRTYNLSPASLPEIIRASARAMEYPLKQKGFELEVHVDENLPPVPVDRDAIEQAVLNLLGNAMKYSGDSRTVGLSVGREDRVAVITVADKGVGIDARDHARIFEKFYRVPTLENQSSPGAGLGLSLVAHIARAHGGSVRVNSAPGEGSVFSIVLPLRCEP